MEQYAEKSEQRSPRAEPGNSASSESAKNSELTSIFQVLLIATVGSAIISAYIIWIGVSGHHRKSVDVAAQAALYAAKQLSQIYVETHSFGKVGICDTLGDDSGSFSYAGAQQRVTGINTIYKTLEVDKTIAEHLHKKFMSDLIDKDVQQIKQVEVELTQKLHEAAEPDMMDAQSHDTSMQFYGNNTQDKQNNIYRDVYRMLAADKSSPDQSLVEVRLKLGRYKPSAGLPVWPSGKIRLLDRSELFESTKNNKAPFAVLVEAVYQPKAKPGSEANTTLTKKSCALITTPAIAPMPSTLILNFPDGSPSVINSGISLLNSPDLKGDGDWQQVSGAEVPGKGTLSPTLQPVLPGMSPSDAFSIALYHWLRGLGPSVDEKKLMALLEATWDSSSAVRRFQADPTPGVAEASQPNSCLAIDSGARGYAILNQTSQGGIGQSAVGNVFNISATGLYGGAQSATEPPNAIPLFIDSKGVCNLAGRKGYDQTLLNDYLQNVFDTNLAAIETAAVARMAIGRATTELNQIDQKVFIERQELNSVQNRLLRLGHKAPTSNKSQAPDEVTHKKEPTSNKSQAPDEVAHQKASTSNTSQAPDEVAHQKASTSNTSQAPDEVAHQTDLANEEIESLKASISGHDEERAGLRKAALLAQRVVNNANQVAISTFDLSSHAFKLGKDGIYRIDKPSKAFILSKKILFTPCTKSADEADFFKPDAETKSESKPWMPRGFDVLTQVADAKLDGTQTIVENQTYEQFMHDSTPQQRPNAAVVFLTSENLLNSQIPKPVISNFYPFDNIRLPSGQLFYYCRDALKTGTSPKVSWSVVIRDLVANVGQNATGQQTGDPIQSDHPEWCKVVEQNSCPGLACELQLRTPLPVVTNPPERSLTNPYNNAQVQQVPPVPADML
ncbi:MAG TPA: hypothetical protein V6C76_13755 [Drouetiella sp.]